ncbi:hypothetical protein [Oceanobacillus sp. CFH 90083]|uniref:hypothetical protein n=1 Tax=Oceanobacillus sp. CFH 90083 TaxID=2592336 RepID=UPI001D13B74F|nr:hypothetical protein [Oceanobacillus sp. CFH 90083]
MSIKKWVSLGIIYVVAVFAVFSVVTGQNPLASGEMEHDEHSGEEAQNHEDHDKEDNQKEAEDMDHSKHDHHNHQEESEVKTNVTYNDEKISIELEGHEGAAPELAVEHEKEMHFIMVSNDLEEYYHLHPEKEQEGLYTINQPLNAGTYQAFVDIAPEGKAYQPAPNTVQVGTSETNKTSLEKEDNWTKEMDGKTVTLEDVEATAGEEVSLVFDMHGEKPEHHLGALGHVVIVDEGAEQYIHVHPDSEDTTSFHAHFPKPGMYKIWAEFKFGDEVHTYPFIIEVAE